MCKLELILLCNQEDHFADIHHNPFTHQQYGRYVAQAVTDKEVVIVDEKFYELMPRMNLLKGIIIVVTDKYPSGTMLDVNVTTRADVMEALESAHCYSDITNRDSFYCLGSLELFKQVSPYASRTVRFVETKGFAKDIPTHSLFDLFPEPLLMLNRHDYVRLNGVRQERYMTRSEARAAATL